MSRRKPTTKKSDEFEHDFLFLRTAGPNGESHNGFRWPTEAGGVVEAPDWNPEPVCGGGLHGLPAGIGDWTLMRPPTDVAARWYVCGALKDEAIDLGGKVKVPRCRVLYVGELAGALQIIAPAMSKSILALVEDRAKAAKPSVGTTSAEKLGAASATGDSGAASATGDSGAASATGYSGAASATGYSGAASATGYSGAASATGYRGAASATGYSGAASATGYRGAASATGEAGVALAAGRECIGMIQQGSLLVLVERDPKTMEIVHYFAAKAGEKGVEAGRWYTLRGGQLVDVTPKAEG